MDVLVSILLPSYNHEAFIEASVRSVMAQEGVSFELLVVDDGSPDQSAPLLRKLQNELGFHLHVRENKGLVYSLNELAAKACGKYICTFASDDIMPAGRLAAQVRFMEEHPKAAACFGQIQILNAKGELNSSVDARYVSGIPQVSFEQLFLGTREVHGCTEMVRRDAFMQVGGFPSKYHVEDFPLWLKLAKQFGDLPVLESVHCYYRVHSTNLHRNLDFIYGGILPILEEYRDHPLYADAVCRWKANWFSSWAYQNKVTALLHLPKCWSFSRHFLRRLPKLFIPRAFLRH